MKNSKLILSIILLLTTLASAVDVEGAISGSKYRLTRAVYLDGEFVGHVPGTSETLPFAFSTEKQTGTISFRSIPVHGKSTEIEEWEQFSFRFVGENKKLEFWKVHLGVRESQIDTISKQDLLVKSTRILPLFQPRQAQFSPLAMLGNPMVLMMVISVILMVFMQFSLPSMQEKGDNASLKKK